MGDNDSTTSGNGGFKSQATKWLFAQGASTVLLTLILGAIALGMYKGVPWIAEEHKNGMKLIRDDFRESLEKQRKDFLEALRRFEPKGG